MFLARPRGMQAVFFAENQHGFLEGQDRKEPNQGYKEHDELMHAGWQVIVIGNAT